MEEDNKIKKIIRLYFGKHFSLNSRILFGRWLRAENGEAEKNSMLQKLWEESSAEVTVSTYEDWNTLQKRLRTKLSDTSRFSFRYQWIKYAAIFVLMFLTATVSYWVADYTKPVFQVEMVELFVPYGESRQVVLPDSSRVWVDAGSLIVYPKDFSDVGTRTVYLTGSASFNVQKNPDKPFIVKTTYMEVEALGTVFTVESYPADSCTTATLEKGSIKVGIDDGNTIDSSILSPNQQLVYSHTTRSMEIRTVDIALYKMAREGYLIFENSSFPHLMTSLERKFNVTIYYNSQKYEGTYNVKFAPEENLKDVLSILQQLIGIQYTIKGNVVFIK
ncbi:FecR family protein [Bacteroides sp.]|uniref:FecR family protein n=1 Tax=Bacteroides sp. TaxID=29523 RepID=UPI00258C7921|nr:FecR family protein [Bacteroides sp.]